MSNHMSNVSKDFYHRGSGHVAAVRMSVMIFIGLIGFSAAICLLS